LDFVKPLIVEFEKKEKIELFHFFRKFNILEGFSFPQNYVTLRILVDPEKRDEIKNEIEEKLRTEGSSKGFAAEENDETYRVGCESYGGVAVIQTEWKYLDWISRITIVLLEKDRNKELCDKDGNPIGVEDVAMKWTHLILLCRL